jgi:hypothetical protein
MKRRKLGDIPGFARHFTYCPQVRGWPLAGRGLRLHPAHRVVEQAGGVLELELRFDVSPVDIHRLGTQVQRGGDFLRALAGAEQLERCRKTSRVTARASARGTRRRVISLAGSQGCESPLAPATA